MAEEAKNQPQLKPIAWVTRQRVNVERRLRDLTLDQGDFNVLVNTLYHLYSNWSNRLLALKAAGPIIEAPQEEGFDLLRYLDYTQCVENMRVLEGWIDCFTGSREIHSTTQQDGKSVTRVVVEPNARVFPPEAYTLKKPEGKLQRMNEVFSESMYPTDRGDLWEPIWDKAFCEFNPRLNPEVKVIRHKLDAFKDDLHKLFDVIHLPYSEPLEPIRMVPQKKEHGN